jgi:hypothetical protein
VEKLELSHIVDGNAKWHIYFGKHHTLNIRYKNPLPRYLPKKKESTPT